MTNELQAVPVGQRADDTTPGFLIDLASRIHAKAIPAIGLDGYDVDRLIEIARGLAEPAFQGELVAIPDALREAAKYASNGTWQFDSEWNADGAYGGGPDHGTGYDDYLILDEQGRTLFGSENSTAKMIEEEYDEDSGTAWDQVGKRNAAFIVAAVNFVRAALSGDAK